MARQSVLFSGTAGQTPTTAQTGAHSIVINGTMVYEATTGVRFLSSGSACQMRFDGSGTLVIPTTIGKAMTVVYTTPATFPLADLQTFATLRWSGGVVAYLRHAVGNQLQLFDSAGTYLGDLATGVTAATEYRIDVGILTNPTTPASGQYHGAAYAGRAGVTPLKTAISGNGNFTVNQIVGGDVGRVGGFVSTTTSNGIAWVAFDDDWTLSIGPPPAGGGTTNLTVVDSVGITDTRATVPTSGRQGVLFSGVAGTTPTTGQTGAGSITINGTMVYEALVGIRCTSTSAAVQLRFDGTGTMAIPTGWGKAMSVAYTTPTVQIGEQHTFATIRHGAGVIAYLRQTVANQIALYDTTSTLVGIVYQGPLALGTEYRVDCGFLVDQVTATAGQFHARTYLGRSGTAPLHADYTGTANLGLLQIVGGDVGRVGGFTVTGSSNGIAYVAFDNDWTVSIGGPPGGTGNVIVSDTIGVLDPAMLVATPLEVLAEVGTVSDTAIATKRSTIIDVTTITGWGASSMEGAFATGHDVLSVLSDDFGVTVTNAGIREEWSAHAAAWSMAIPALLTVTGNSIPASGPVAVTAHNFGTTNGNVLAYHPGTLAGVHGVLTWAASAWVFTRDAAGSATSCPPGTTFFSDVGASNYSTTHVIWTGKNDWTVGTDTQGAIDRNLAMWNYFAAGNPKRAVVLGAFYDQNQAPGGAARLRGEAFNTALSLQYGVAFISVQGYLASSQLWDDTGIVPTATDLQNQADGVLPMSVSTNFQHLNDAGYWAVGEFIADRLVQMNLYPTTAMPVLVSRFDARTLAFSDGAAVTSWTPAPGSIEPAVAMPVGAAPVYHVSQINGLPAVTFVAASSHRMDTGAWSTEYNTPLTVISMWRRNTQLLTQNVYSGRGAAYAFAGARGSDGSLDAGAGGTEQLLLLPGTEGWFLTTVVYNGTRSRMYLNEVIPQVTGTTGTNPVTAGLPGLRLGSTAAGTANFLDGQVALVEVWDGALSLAQVRYRMETLRTLYGLGRSLTLQVYDPVGAGDTMAQEVVLVSIADVETETYSLFDSITATKTSPGAATVTSAVTVLAAGSIGVAQAATAASSVTVLAAGTVGSIVAPVTAVLTGFEVFSPLDPSATAVLTGFEAYGAGPTSGSTAVLTGFEVFGNDTVLLAVLGGPDTVEPDEVFTLTLSPSSGTPTGFAVVQTAGPDCAVTGSGTTWTGRAPFLLPDPNDVPYVATFRGTVTKAANTSIAYWSLEIYPHTMWRRVDNALVPMKLVLPQ